MYTIGQDFDVESPREWRQATMALFHNRYRLPNESDLQAENFRSWDEMSDAIDSNYLPVYMYDHSGLWVSTEPFFCPWHSGQVGFIFGTDDAVLKQEVETFNQYLQGDIWYYICDNGESCGGIYGYDECERQAKEACGL